MYYGNLLSSRRLNAAFQVLEKEDNLLQKGVPVAKAG